MNTGGEATERRAQSEVLSYLLVFAILMTGAMIVVGFGVVMIGDSEDELTTDRAENTLTQIDSKAGLVALGDANSRRVTFPTSSGEQFRLDENAGWMNVTARDHATGETIHVANISMGAVIFEGESQTLAYQGGGVWRENADGGLMVSPPEPHYREATLTLPAINLTGDAILGGDVVIEHDRTVRKFPNVNTTNPLDNHVLDITVKSQFYKGWGEYFEERTDGEVNYNDDTQQVSSELVSPIGDVRIEAAVQGQALNGNLLFQANPDHPCHGGSNPPYFDRYDSREAGSYCDQYNESEISRGGDFIFGGDIETQAAAGEIQGNLISGGAVDLFQNQPLHGNVTHVDGCKDCQAAQDEASSTDPYAVPDGGYTITQTDTVGTGSSIDLTVNQAIREFRQQFNETTITGGDKLTAGLYYTDEIDLSGGDVELNTSGGDITIAVNNTIHLDSGANINITGNNRTRFYVGGSQSEDDLMMDSSNWFAPDNNATQMVMLGGSDFNATLTDSQYTGAIYAPAGASGDGDVSLVKGANVFGGIVTGDMIIGSPGGGTVHHDAALTDLEIVPPDVGIVRVTFLHVTENHIIIKNS